jgi:hypothetical protein
MYGGVEVVPKRFYLNSRQRSVVSFTPRSLYPVGKSPQYPSDMRLDYLMHLKVKAKIKLSL